MINTSSLVDFHCHLDLYPDHLAAVRESEEAGVFTLAVTTTPKAWPRNHQIAQTTQHVHAALGLHPQLVAERASELPLWEKHLKETRYIGEVGLDAGPRFYKSFDLQKKVFEHILCCCGNAGNKILTVHSTRAVTAVLDHIEAYLPPGQGNVVLHWFTGSKAEATRAIELGCYFSINASMLDNTRHAAMVSTIPLNRMLTETDGPFTTTSMRPSRPKDVGIVVERLSRLQAMPAESFAMTIQGNLINLLEQNGEGIL